MVGEELLGREEPLARLRGVVDRAAGGIRSLALVSGPAGIGKSSLVRSAVAGTDRTGWGTCVEAVAAPGYWPWTRALDGIAASAGSDVAIAAAADDAPLLALIGRSFGPAATGAGDERDRLLLMDAVSRWLGRVARPGAPVVVVLDDLQWADESSLALLEFVARDPTPGAVAVVACYRHDELPAVVRGRLSQLSMAATTIELRGLDRPAVAALATSVSGPLSEAAVDDLYRRAGGHPVFTRELARFAEEGTGLPEAVRDAIERRIARLAPATQDVLALAAVAGNEIKVEVLAAAADQPMAAVEDALGEALEAGVVDVDADGLARLAHDLYREAIVASIAGERRAQLHRRLGSELEARSARGLPVVAAELARHFAAAVRLGEVERAARWARAAAAVDVESLAFVEAASHLRRWRESVMAVGAQVEDRDFAVVLLAEADALARSGSVDEARARLRTAWARAAAPGLRDLRADVALAVADLGARYADRRDEVLELLGGALEAVGDDLDREARLAARLARELQHSVAADRPRAEPLSERALDLGRRSADPRTLVACLLARHDVLWVPGAPGDRVGIAQEIVAVAERIGDRERAAEGQLLLANAWLELGSASFVGALEACLRLLDDLGQPRHRYIAATRRAAIRLLRGELDQAETAIEDAADLGAAIREPDAGNVRMSQRLELVRARGVSDELLEFAESAVSHWTGAPVHAHAIAAGFTARAGDLVAARRHVAAVAGLGSWRADRSYLWSVGVRELAVAAIATYDRPTAADLYDDVVSISGTCGVNGAVVAFAGSHGHVAGLVAEHLGRGGRELLDDAIAVYERLGAVTFLDELRPATRRPFAGLTAREHEVLELIARGRSNEEIVAELVVSPATVRNHITRIFRKLDVTSRAQAIVMAREAGLV